MSAEPATMRAIRSIDGAHIVIAICLVAAGLLGWHFYSSPPQIKRSVIGLNGFTYFARAQGLEIDTFAGGNRLEDHQYGLRILPLYDPDVGTFSRTDDSTEPDLKTEMRRIRLAALRTKIRTIPTLIILPKWRFGVLRLEKLHPRLLIDVDEMKFPVRDLGGWNDSKFVQGPAALTQIRLRGSVDTPHGANPAFNADVTLYAPQSIRLHNATECTAAVSDGPETYLLRCKLLGKRDPVWVVTDPDLFNNHGASRGNNAAFALQLVRELAGGKPILVDHTVLVSRPSKGQAGKQDRTVADLVRFFEYPFSYFWLSLLCLVLFTLWHAWRRYGPADDGEAEQGVGASKRTSIEANVHILRATNSDRPLAARHAEQRMDRLAREILGPHRKRGPAGEAQLVAAIARKSPGLADRLGDLRGELRIGTTRNPSNPQPNLARTLHAFEQTLEEIAHEFGRTTTARR